MQGQDHTQASANMSRAARMLGVLVALMATAAVAGVAPARAAAPSNDDFAGATPLAIGSTQTLDTSEATLDTDAAELLADACGQPPVAATVWFTYTAAEDGVVVLDAVASDYFVSMVVTTGAPGAWTPDRCYGEGGFPFYARAGTTYSILAFEDPAFGGAGTGGTLQLSVGARPYPVLTANPTGTLDVRTGAATVTGTANCPEGEIFEAQIFLDQLLGRVTTVKGSTSIELVCDGQTHPWSANVPGFTGRFSGGSATLRIRTTYGFPFGFSFGFVSDCTGRLFDCYSTQRTIRLRGGK